jgi:hypothetical protein
MKDREIRRFANMKLEKKRSKYETIKDNDRERKKKSLLHNPKNCSCHVCGNPRRYSKGEERLTMQERRNKEELRWFYHNKYYDDYSTALDECVKHTKLTKRELRSKGWNISTRYVED